MHYYYTYLILYAFSLMKVVISTKKTSLNIYSSLLWPTILSSLTPPRGEKESVTYGLAVELWLLYLQPWKTSNSTAGTVNEHLYVHWCLLNCATYLFSNYSERFVYSHCIVLLIRKQLFKVISSNQLSLFASSQLFYLFAIITFFQLNLFLTIEDYPHRILFLDNSQIILLISIPHLLILLSYIIQCTVRNGNTT